MDTKEREVYQFILDRIENLEYDSLDYHKLENEIDDFYADGKISYDTKSVLMQSYLVSRNKCYNNISGGSGAIFDGHVAIATVAKLLLGQGYNELTPCETVNELYTSVDTVRQYELLEVLYFQLERIFGENGSNYKKNVMIALREGTNDPKVVASLHTIGSAMSEWVGNPFSPLITRSLINVKLKE